MPAIGPAIARFRDPMDALMRLSIQEPVKMECE
jgi:hypothetical protein